MEETKPTFADDEGEETMVAPRFDDEETMVARPVVPFEEVGDAPASSTALPPPAAARTPLYSRLRVAPRRSLVAALVLVSVLAGSVLGVGGLYLYQKQRNAAAASHATQQQAEAPAAQPTVEPAAEPQGREADAPAVAEASTPAPVSDERAAKPDADADAAAKNSDSKEPARVGAAERRNVSDNSDSTAAPKRGKKGERDEEPQRAQRAPRYDEDTQPVVRDNDSDDDRREARRVGVITYRQRRARPRRDRYDTPDRLRRIFEGQP